MQKRYNINSKLFIIIIFYFEKINNKKYLIFMQIFQNIHPFINFNHLVAKSHKITFLTFTSTSYLQLKIINTNNHLTFIHRLIH